MMAIQNSKKIQFAETQELTRPKAKWRYRDILSDKNIEKIYLIKLTS